MPVFEQHKNQEPAAETIRQHARRIPSHLAGLCVVLLLAVIMFANVLFTTKDIVLSNKNSDIALHYVHLRAFGFKELSGGNLPLWNPHIFCGTPYVGGFLSAMFYPPNLIFLVLPLSAAINWCIVLHLFLAGLFTYFWAAYRGLSALACTVAAVIVMFCGAVFAHVFAGHLAQLCTMAWVPLLLLSIDGLLNCCSLRWVLVGMLAAAMQSLAGFPQYMFYTSLAATLYLMLQLIQTKRKLFLIVAFAAIFAGGAALSAVQLLAGFEATVGSTRENKIPYNIAGSFSFPPENLLTILSPNFFGPLGDYTYWGASDLCEMTLFVSVTALILAAYGLVCSKSSYRYTLAVPVLITFTLALGSHTPLFKFLYNYVPGFDKFRGSSKFIYPATLFMLMLTAIGFDNLSLRPRFIRRASLITFAMAVLIALSGWSIRHSAQQTGVSAGWWANFMLDVRNTAIEKCELHRPSQDYKDPKFIAAAGCRASTSLYLAAGICAAVSALIWARQYSGRVVYAIALLLFAELLYFVWPLCTTFSLTEAHPLEIEEFLAKQEGDFRVFNPLFANLGMSTGTYDIGGYDAMILRRYAELMFFAAGQNPDNAAANTVGLVFISDPLISRLYQMLRCCFIFYKTSDGIHLTTVTQPLQRFNLLTDYRVLAGRDVILKAMADPLFDPAKTVILESEPSCKPAGNPVGHLRIIDESTDHLTIEGQIENPAILLITDSYHHNWSARSLPGSVQAKYEVLPADYALRAIPLMAGTHRFRMEYRPPLFYVGLWVSILSLIAYLAAWIWLGVNRYKNKQ
jgi:hypothetical protein